MLNIYRAVPVKRNNENYFYEIQKLNIYGWYPILCSLDSWSRQEDPEQAKSWGDWHIKTMKKERSFKKFIERLLDNIQVIR